MAKYGSSKSSIQLFLTISHTIPCEPFGLTEIIRKKQRKNSKMKYSTSIGLLGLAATPLAAAATVSVTPHDKFSSSVGVLGCKVDTDRLAYWPGSPDCNNFCKKLSAGPYSLYVMHLDSSGGAHDISYDAWVYLQTGQTATTKPIMGGGFPVNVEQASPQECAHLLNDGKMPFTAQNGANFYTSCMASNSWIGNNAELFGITNMACTLGVDEPCTVDPASMQPVCPSGFKPSNQPLAGHTVWDIEYGTGRRVAAL